LISQPSLTPGWYPDPTGTARRAYWNGREWGSPPPKSPFKKPVFIIVVGNIVGGLGVLGFLGNIGSGGDSATPTASILTKTVTVTAPPPISTVTVVAAPPAPRIEPPAPTSYPPIEAPPPLPPVGLLMPPIPSSAYYGSCAAARAAGAAPLRVGKPGYRPGLDPDGNGVACE
jgi:hypothetical protein